MIKRYLAYFKNYLPMLRLMIKFGRQATIMKNYQTSLHCELLATVECHSTYLPKSCHRKNEAHQNRSLYMREATENENFLAKFFLKSTATIKYSHSWNMLLIGANIAFFQTNFIIFEILVNSKTSTNEPNHD